MKKLIALITAVLQVLTILLPIAQAQTEELIASLQVGEQCTLSLSTNTLNFLLNGQPVLPGQTSDHATVTLTNSGNANMTALEISGTNWSGSVAHTMPSTQTKYQVGGGAFSDLSTTPASITPLAVGSSSIVGMHVVVPAGQASDTYTQTITFAFEC